MFLNSNRRSIAVKWIHNGESEISLQKQTTALTLWYFWYQLLISDVNPKGWILSVNCSNKGDSKVFSTQPYRLIQKDWDNVTVYRFLFSKNWYSFGLHILYLTFLPEKLVSEGNPGCTDWCQIGNPYVSEQDIILIPLYFSVFT